jgi:hypothetical protein
MSTKNGGAQEWVVDQIEENSVCIEVDGVGNFHVPRSLLPHGAKDGDILRVTIEIDVAATKKAMEASAEQVKKGRESNAKYDSGGGDIKL